MQHDSSHLHGHYRRAVYLALTASVLLHGSMVLWSRRWSALPEVDFEVVKPNAVEFGVVEPAASAAAVAPEPPPSAARATGASEPTPPQPEGPKPAPKRKPARPPEPRNAFPEAGQAGRLAPQGSQLALRLDVERVEAGPLASEVGQLLTAIPDVQWLLAGSGVEPMRDLARLFIASPDLRREHVVLAGRYRGGEHVPRDAVAQLAQLREQPAPWREQHGIALAPWLNESSEPRVLALLGPALFAIARENDLARVLSVAHSLQPTSGRSASDSLVHMAEHELMNISVDSARSFVRGSRTTQVPERFTVSVRAAQPSSDGLEVTLSGRFPDAQQARDALQYWEQLRDRYADNTLVALLGVSALLRSMKLTVHAEQLGVQLHLSVAEARLLLRFVRDSLHTPRPPPRGGTP